MKFFQLRKLILIERFICLNKKEGKDLIFFEIKKRSFKKKIFFFQNPSIIFFFQKTKILK